MSYAGDITLGDTIHVKFSTVSTAGVPTTLAGTPEVSAYVGGSLTQITAGITLTVDYDGVTGLHDVTIVASGANGYTTGTNVSLVITTGTVGGTSVVGYVIGSFSIGNRSAFARLGAPAGADIAADIAAVKAETANILTDTAEIGAAGAGLTALATQASVNTIDGIVDAILVDTAAMPTAAAITTAILTTQMTESYRADQAAPTLAQATCEILAHLGESSIVTTTKTIKQLDGSTTAMTFTLDDATTPTSITRAT